MTRIVREVDEAVLGEFIGKLLHPLPARRAHARQVGYRYRPFDRDRAQEPQRAAVLADESHVFAGRTHAEERRRDFEKQLGERLTLAHAAPPSPRISLRPQSSILTN